MRAAKVILFSVPLLVGLLVPGIAGFVLYQSVDKEDTFVLENATIKSPDYVNRLAGMDKKTHLQNRREFFHAASHRLAGGAGTIFAYRYYTNGRITAVDDELYRKVTIWLREAPDTHEFTVDLGDRQRAILVYSHGGSAWPAYGCSGYATSGTVKINQHGERYNRGFG